MTADERDMTPPGVFTMFPLEPFPADLLSGGNGLQRNLDRMAERVREEAIAEFMASPEAKAAQAELQGWQYQDGADDDAPYRPEQVQARGRWRRRKQVLRKFAAELGYPECMEVAHPEQIDGAVMQAGVRLRDFYKLHHVRTTPAQAKAERAQKRADKREMAACLRRGEPPF